MPTTREPRANQYNGLSQHTHGLPADVYFDLRRYDLEMQRIWNRNWIYVCRSSEIAKPRAFRTFELGDQRLLLVRDEAGVLRGYHNTCRHRGAALCQDEAGVLRSGAVVCPYHAWTYSLQGQLLRTSSKRHAAGFDTADYPLYAIHVQEWRGFIFVALTAAPPFEDSFDPPNDRFGSWPLEELAVGHVLLKNIKCNWKIFWENFNECLHCPGVHPSLCQLVPIYGRGLVREGDDPHWERTAENPDPLYRGGLRHGAQTWSADGQLTGAPFAGVSEDERRRGAVYLTNMPSVFLVGHVDYVRVVRLRPLGPELTELRVEYLFSPDTLANPQFELRNIVDFTNTVMSEDAEVCELNQQGLRAAPHVAGVVMPEEYLVRQFHEWIGSELARA